MSSRIRPVCRCCKDATTPAFIIHGAGLHVLDADYAGYEYAKALEGAGKLVRYKTYPNETYYVYGRENTRTMLQDMLEFFDTYLKDGISGTEGKAIAAGTSGR